MGEGTYHVLHQAKSLDIGEWMKFICTILNCGIIDQAVIESEGLFLLLMGLADESRGEVGNGQVVHIDIFYFIFKFFVQDDNMLSQEVSSLFVGAESSYLLELFSFLSEQ